MRFKANLESIADDHAADSPIVREGHAVALRYDEFKIERRPDGTWTVTACWHGKAVATLSAHIDPGCNLILTGLDGRMALQWSAV